MTVDAGLREVVKNAGAESRAGTTPSLADTQATVDAGSNPAQLPPRVITRVLTDGIKTKDGMS